MVSGRSNVIGSIDIGTTTTTVIIAHINSNSELEIIGLGTAPSRGLRKGVVINIEATVESISKALSQAETMAGCEISSVFASISGSHIKGFNSHGIVGIRNREVSAFDVGKVIEAAKAVAIPMDREILHVLPQEFIIDDQDGIKDPIGISGVRLEVRVHIVTGSIASAQNIVKCANRCGLTVQDIVLASLGSGKSVLSQEEQELGACVLDIGGGTTDITVFQGGAVKFTAVLPIGGNHITNDIAAGLRTPVLAAEDVKCRFGSVSIKDHSRDETIEVPSTGGRAPRIVPRAMLSEIIEARVSEILTLVRDELEKAGVMDSLSAGVVLTGGCANLKGILELAESKIALPVRIGLPNNIKGLNDLVKSPRFATSVGLLMYGKESTVGKRLYSGRSLVSRLFQKVGNWFSEHL